MINDNSTPEPVIAISGLRKSYAGREVLHGIDLNVLPARITGFLGPNGAGKTTTIRILIGLIYRSAGEVRLFGQEISAGQHLLRAQVGYLPADVRFPSGMSGQQVLKFYASARRVDCLIEAYRLADRLSLDLSKLERTYSTGNRQKLGLVQAMMHRPQLLILDEPTSGLDPLIREALFDELRNVTREGRTVLFSSHSLSEVEALCDQVIIVRDGRVIQSGAISLLRSSAVRRVQLEFASSTAIPQPFPSSLNLIEQSKLQLLATWSGTTNELLAWLTTLDLSDASIHKPDLEDLFLSYYSQTTADVQTSSKQTGSGPK
ncbi:MAG: ABC transporter ATP-binding protein [Pirellulales bacterium]